MPKVTSIKRVFRLSQIYKPVLISLIIVRALNGLFILDCNFSTKTISHKLEVISNQKDNGHRLENFPPSHWWRSECTHLALYAFVRIKILRAHTYTFPKASCCGAISMSNTIFLDSHDFLCLAGWMERMHTKHTPFWICRRRAIIIKNKMSMAYLQRLGHHGECQCTSVPCVHRVCPDEGQRPRCI